MHRGQFDYNFVKFHLAVKIYLVEQVYNLKIKQVFRLLSKLCNESVVVVVELPQAPEDDPQKR